MIRHEIELHISQSSQKNHMRLFENCTMTFMYFEGVVRGHELQRNDWQLSKMVPSLWILLNYFWPWRLQAGHLFSLAITWFYNKLEIKPCGLGSRIRDVEAFWYKTEIKIIYFVPLCLIVLIVSDCMVYPDPKFLIFKYIQN